MPYFLNVIFMHPSCLCVWKHFCKYNRKLWLCFLVQSWLCHAGINCSSSWARMQNATFYEMSHLLLGGHLSSSPQRRKVASRNVWESCLSLPNRRCVTEDNEYILALAHLSLCYSLTDSLIIRNAKVNSWLCAVIVLVICLVLTFSHSFQCCKKKVTAEAFTFKVTYLEFNRS